jgi:hypothetical protein
VKHPKDIGDVSTLAITLALRVCGYGIYAGRLRLGSIVFAVCSCYGHHRNPATARRTYEGQIDLFAVYCPQTSGVYLVPIEDLPMKTAAYLRVDPPRNNQRQRIRFAADYEVGRVPIEGLRASSGA